MGVSKVVLGEETLVDLTSDSVSEENLLEGATAHGADGEPVKGIVEIKPKTLTTTKTGEQIHLVDSTDNKVVEFALYGKATQDRTPSPENHVDIVVAGESYNLLEITPKSQTVNGVVFTVNSDGSVSVAGKETSGNNSGFMLTNTLVLPAGQYVVSHGYNGSFNTMWLYVHTKETQTFLCNVTNIEQTITLTEKTTIQMSIYVKAGVTIYLIKVINT